jgi:uncharacterized protein (TIGR02145 family)
MTDPRDGQTYKTVTIGSQTWMAENLNYQDERLSIEESLAGKLYTWDDAVNSDGLFSFDVIGCTNNPGSCRVPDNWRGICPEGWHIPSSSEWKELLFVVTGGLYDRKSARISDRYIKVLRSTSGWEADYECPSSTNYMLREKCNINGTDLYGFSIYPSKICHECSAWTSEVTFLLPERSICETYMCYDYLTIQVSGLFESLGWVEDGTRRYEGAEFWGEFGSEHSSVRCVKDENVEASSNTYSSLIASSSSSESSSLIASSSSKVSSSSIAYEIGTMTDSRDGKVYKTVTIGTQTWMAENLNYEAKEGSYCYDEGDLKTENCDEYGRMYNWASAVDACPVAWRLPTRGEWEALLQFASGEYRDGFALKSSTGWNSDGNGGDVYGFSALPVTCEYGISGIQTSFWSATESSSGYAYMLTLNYDTDFSALNHRPKVTKCPVRCIKKSE